MALESHHRDHLTERRLQEKWWIENLRTSLNCGLAIRYQIVMICTWLVELNLNSAGTISKEVDEIRLYCHSGLNSIQTKKVCSQMDMTVRALRKHKGHLWKMQWCDRCCVFPTNSWKVWDHHISREKKLVYATHHSNKINNRVGDGTGTVCTVRCANFFPSYCTRSIIWKNTLLSSHFPQWPSHIIIYY